MKTLRLLTLVAGLTVILFSVKAQKYEHKQKTMQERFILTDMNKDGEITLEEFNAAEKKLMEKREEKQKARFEAIDKNGKVSPNEFYKQRKKQSYRKNKKHNKKYSNQK